MDLLPYAKPIFVLLNKIVTVKLKQLKDLFDELIDKSFIKPYNSTWGAPILIVKKERWFSQNVY